MIYRKMYIKLCRFFYLAKGTLNKIAVTSMITILLYVVVNSFVFGNIIFGKAQFEEIEGRYPKAIELYNVAYCYYKLNHFSQDNKKIYFAIPYRISMCYLREGNKEKSVANMLLGITTIQQQYGILSKETGYFVRKYLIEYYLDNNNNTLARQEFNNLLLIYKTAGYDDNELSDMIRLSGDLYYQQHQYDQAMAFYDKAYKEISTQSQIDYEVFAKIVYRICDYEVTNDRLDNAVSVYKSSIEILKNSGRKQNEITATMLIRAGDLFSKEDDNQVSKNAIPYYEEAIVLIRTLPRNSYLRQNLKNYLEILKDLDTKDSQFHNVQVIDSELTKMKRFPFIYE